MKRIYLLLLLLLPDAMACFAQSGVAIGSTAPDAKAILDITSTTKGLLIPRMSGGNKTSMGSGLPEGLMIYQTDGVKGLYIYNGSAWIYQDPAGVTSIVAGTGLAGGTITTTGTISMPNVGTAGTYGNATTVPQITTDAQGRVSAVSNVAIAPPSTQTCPGGYSTIEFSRSRLCIYHDVFSATWNSGTLYCNSLFSGASICTYSQLRRACLSGSLTLTAERWIGDRVGDDLVLYTNGTDCNNFDGTASSISGTKPGTYCCLEYMKY